MEQPRPDGRRRTRYQPGMARRGRSSWRVVAWFLLTVLPLGVSVLTPATVRGRSATLSVRVELASSVVAPGQLQGVGVTVTSDGVPRSGVPISVDVIGTEGSLIASGSGVTDADGEFLAVLRIPAGTPPGWYQALTTATVNGARISAEAQTFGVTAPIASLEVVRLLGEGISHLRRGDAAGALATSTEALDLARRNGDRVGEGLSLLRIGRVYLVTDQYAPALEFLEQALPVARAAGDRTTERDVLSRASAMSRICAASTRARWASIRRRWRSRGRWPASRPYRRRERNCSGARSSQLSARSLPCTSGRANVCRH